MKKVLFVGILSILCISASFAQARFGVTAGLNASKLSVSGEEDEMSFDFKAGSQVGVLMDYSINENFSIIPELLFSQRGAKFKISNFEDLDVEDLDIKAKATMTLNYLQLPVNAAYKFDVGYGSKLFIFAGPYVGYGISAKAKGESSYEGVKVSMSEDLKFGSGEDEIKPFDFGINVGLGYEYQKIFFKLQYNHGLTNLNNGSEGTMKNMNVALTAGYFFK